MESIPRCPLPDKVILIHNGALGDFFLAWPTAWAAAGKTTPGGLYWAGAADRMPWLEPLGYRLCPPEVLRALDRLHGADRWPTTLRDLRAFWLVLEKTPRLPRYDHLHFLRALPPPGGAEEGYDPHAQGPNHDRQAWMRAAEGSRGGQALPRAGQRTDGRPAQPATGSRSGQALPRMPLHVREAWLGGMSGLLSPEAPDGRGPVPNWSAAFRQLFASRRSPGDTVLLFPGAGHPGKQWPLVQFFLLADLLTERGLEPLFVLGPAELERGLLPEGRAWAAPDDLQALQTLILKARAVVGPDTGPMHLAGMLGVPGVGLFGPTDPAIWGPVGIRHLRAHAPCSPCTRDCSDIECNNFKCLSDISPERVLREVLSGVEKCKTGFQGPGFLESRFCQKEEGCME